MEKKSDTSMLVQSVKRNILFWGRQAEIVFLMFLVAILFYGIFMGSTIRTEASGTFAQVMEEIKIYAMIFGIIMPFLTFFTYAIPRLNMALSFGAKRSETILGVHFMVWLLNIQMFLVIFVCNTLAGESFEWVKSYLVALLLCTAFGELSGCMALKFGNKSIWISVILMIVGCIAAGVLFTLFEYWTAAENGVFQYLILIGFAVGLILYIIGTLIWKKLLSSYEVKM